MQLDGTDAKGLPLSVALPDFTEFFLTFSYFFPTWAKSGKFDLMPSACLIIIFLTGLI